MGRSRARGAKAITADSGAPGSQRQALDRPGGRAASAHGGHADPCLSMKPFGRVVSVFGVNPSRIGGGEVFARALSERLATRGWESVLVYQTLPAGDGPRFL